MGPKEGQGRGPGQLAVSTQKFLLLLKRSFPANTAHMWDPLLVSRPLPSISCGGSPRPSLAVILEHGTVSQLWHTASRAAFTKRLSHTWLLFQLFSFSLLNLFNHPMRPGAHSLPIFWGTAWRHRDVAELTEGLG